MAKLHLAQQILDIIYPIGSIYMSVNSTNPNSLFGGTWERIKGRFLLGADDSTYKNGNTGGESSHTLTESEIPAHNHQQWSFSWKQSGNMIYQEGTNYGLTNAFNDRTGNTGGGKSHNNMPPYLAVYMWKRTK